MTRVIAIVWVLVAVVGCSQQAGPMPKATTDAVTPATFNAAGAPTVAFNVPDMMCPEGCGAKTKEILSGQPGVQEVVVDFDSKTATVAVGGVAKFDPSAAVAALVDHGFKNSSIKSGAAAAGQTPPSSTEKAKAGGAS